MTELEDVKLAVTKLNDAKVKAFTPKYLSYQLHLSPLIIKQLLDKYLDDFGLIKYFSILNPDDVGQSVELLSLNDVNLGDEFENKLTGEIFELYSDSQIETKYMFKKYFKQSDFI